jgi:phosphonate metabolism protein PhnN/1,5-bisphosphokinase (PRPP-forming)
VVLVVGPSGAGKDAVLGAARERLAGDGRFLFPRRVVTREANLAEDHVSLSRAAFEAQLQCGGFALHWEAHGLRYGIPASAEDAVLSGRTVVFNASRETVAVARDRYAAAAAVLVDAPPEVRAARLAARSREAPEEVLVRLQRVATGFSAADADLVIDNGGLLEDAVDLLVRWLRSFAGAPP